MADNHYYKGNVEVKKKGVLQTFTQEQVQEIVKCSKDIEYFLSNYIYIISLDEGKVLFKPYEFQKEMLKVFAEKRMVICNLARQQGKCCAKGTNIRIRNKKTGEVVYQPIGKFFNQRKNEYTNHY